MTAISTWQYDTWKAQGFLEEKACKQYWTGDPPCPHGKRVDMPVDLKECKSCPARQIK